MNVLFSTSGESNYRDVVSRHIAWGHWFLLGNILLSMVIALRYILASPLPDTGMAQLYLLLSWIGHFGFIGFMLFLLSIFPLTFVITHHRLLRGTSVFIASLLQILLLIDTQVYQLLKFHLNPFVWNLLLENSQSKASLNWNFLFVVIPLIVMLEIVFSTLAWKRQFRRRRPWQGRSIGALFILCFLSTHLMHIWADARVYVPITAQKSNFPLSYPMTARSFLAKHGWLDLDAFQAQRATTTLQGHRRLLYPLSPLQVTPPGQHYNLLLITLHGLRADALTPTVMPNLSLYAGQHDRFNQHFAGDNDADSSLFSLFYGLPAAYMDDALADKRAPLLMDELQRQDYQIRTFATHKLDAPIYKAGLFSGLRQAYATINQSNDAESVGALVNWVGLQSSAARPWFAWLQMDAPGNLDLPAGITGPFQPETAKLDPLSSPDKRDRQRLINHYHNGAWYADQQIGRLLQTLDSTVLANTVVVITADQGFELADHTRNNWGSGLSYAPEALQVPLIIGWPGNQTGQVSSSLSSHLDLAPTLLQRLLGVSSPEGDYATGNNLYPTRDRNWLLLGNMRNFVIVTDQDITVFDRQGQFEIRDRQQWRRRKDSRPDVPVLLKVMRDLNQFKGSRPVEAAPH